MRIDLHTDTARLLVAGILWPPLTRTISARNPRAAAKIDDWIVQCKEAEFLLGRITKATSETGAFHFDSEWSAWLQQHRLEIATLGGRSERKRAVLQLLMQTQRLDLLDRFLWDDPEPHRVWTTTGHLQLIQDWIEDGDIPNSRADLASLQTLSATEEDRVLLRFDADKGIQEIGRLLHEDSRTKDALVQHWNAVLADEPSEAPLGIIWSTVSIDGIAIPHPELWSAVSGR